MKKLIMIAEGAMEDAITELHDSGIENLTNVADDYRLDKMDLLDAFTAEFEEDDESFDPAFTLYVNDEENDSGDSVEELLKLVADEYSHAEWHIEDNNTGEIVQDGEGSDEEVVPTQAQIDQSEIDRATELKAQPPRAIGQVMKRGTDGYLDSDLTDYSKNDIRELARQMEDSVHQTFPDGDPMDHVMHWAEHEMGWDWYSVQDELMPAALKQFKARTGYDSMYDMVADMWDDVAGDNPDVMGTENPWR